MEGHKTSAQVAWVWLLLNGTVVLDWNQYYGNYQSNWAAIPKGLSYFKMFSEMMQNE